MPALPLVEQIAQNIEDTLRGINTVAGYHNNVTVERAQRENSGTDDCLLVIYQGNEYLPDEGVPHNRIEWMQPFAVDCYIVQQDDSIPPERRMNTIRADVRKAIMVDPHRGGLAIDTIIRPSQIFPVETGGSFAGVTVLFDVHYRVELGDENAHG